MSFVSLVNFPAFSDAAALVDPLINIKFSFSAELCRKIFRFLHNDFGYVNVGWDLEMNGF